jgi:hypothetical protein
MNGPPRPDTGIDSLLFFLHVKQYFKSLQDVTKLRALCVVVGYLMTLSVSQDQVLLVVG